MRPSVLANPVYLTLTLNWDKLPACFRPYYASYNYYLAGFQAIASSQLCDAIPAYTVRCEVRQVIVGATGVRTAPVRYTATNASYCIMPGTQNELGFVLPPPDPRQLSKTRISRLII